MIDSNAKKINEFQDFLKLKHRAESTISSYCSAVKTFLCYYNKEAYRITKQEIINYLLCYENASSYNHIRFSLQEFYTEIIKQPVKIAGLPYAKREQKIPEILSVDQIRKGMAKISNLKHLCICKLLYGCGFRLNDVRSMKPNWILRDQGVIKVHQGKGKKDRLITMDDELLSDLEKYYLQFKPKNWMFNGQYGTSQYSEKSIQAIVSKYFNTHPHVLRHSFATHLMDAGVNSRLIQEMMGHSNPKTTERYMHVSSKNISNIKSPLSYL